MQDCAGNTCFESGISLICGGFALSGSNWNSYHGGDGMGTAVDPFEENTYYGMTQYGGAYTAPLLVEMVDGQTMNSLPQVL